VIAHIVQIAVESGGQGVHCGVRLTSGAGGIMPWRSAVSCASLTRGVLRVGSTVTGFSMFW
jgi:hypothetical protein